jgi:hypothetical protein
MTTTTIRRITTRTSDRGTTSYAHDPASGM